ncbi:hypothetical protein ISR92_02770 [Patescibacteria group bacterium]|nr:hypothetical protein [Patescibacteria group bacterium]
MLKIAYYIVLGKPLIFYTGILTILLLFLTASVSILAKYNIKWLPGTWHKHLATITMIMAIIHGLMGLSNYF